MGSCYHQYLWGSSFVRRPDARHEATLSSAYGLVVDSYCAQSRGICDGVGAVHHVQHWSACGHFADACLSTFGMCHFFWLSWPTPSGGPLDGAIHSHFQYYTCCLLPVGRPRVRLGQSADGNTYDCCHCDLCMDAASSADSMPCRYCKGVMPNRRFISNWKVRRLPKPASVPTASMV